MSILEILLIAVGLAMDAFAVAICKGLSMKKINLKKTLIVGIYFGLFQAIMPAVGYFLGSFFENLVIQVDHWIAFILLSVIGINMIKEVFSKDDEQCNDSVDFGTMVVLAIATSIDALAVGITFAFLKTNIIISALTIGIVTFLISVAGVKIGNKFGDKFEKKSQFAGGLILIFIGLKILLEHLSII